MEGKGRWKGHGCYIQSKVLMLPWVLETTASEPGLQDPGIFGGEVGGGAHTGGVKSCPVFVLCPHGTEWKGSTLKEHML